MVFENHRKSLIQHCERSELHLHIEWTKVHEKCPKGQKSGEKCRNSNATFLVIFKQLCLDIDSGEIIGQPQQSLTSEKSIFPCQVSTLKS